MVERRHVRRLHEILEIIVFYTNYTFWKGCIGAMEGDVNVGVSAGVEEEGLEGCGVSDGVAGVDDDYEGGVDVYSAVEQGAENGVPEGLISNVMLFWGRKGEEKIGC